MPVADISEEVQFHSWMSEEYPRARPRLQETETVTVHASMIPFQLVEVVSTRRTLHNLSNVTPLSSVYSVPPYELTLFCWHSFCQSWLI